MIRNENEYKEAVRRLGQDKEVMEKQREALKKADLSKQEVEKAMEPILSFHEQLVEEVNWYERMKRGDFGAISSLRQIGRILIALRIAKGITQAELAERLNVSETQVSRDERNEYHGISVDRAQKIFDIFHAHLDGKIEMNEPPHRRALAKAS